MSKQDRSARALAAAERLFKRKPDASTEEFRKVCERADSEVIGKLDNREFNASYVLPFRRSKALRGRSMKPARKKAKNGRRRGRRSGRGGRPRGSSARDRIVQLIRERDAEVMAAAGDAGKAYEVASGLPDFADEILKAAGK